MKSCPFCAEEIRDAAVVCKHCGRDLVAPPSRPIPLVGAWLAAAGAFGLVFYYLIFSVAVGSVRVDSSGDMLHARTVNLGRMSDRQIGLIVSAVIAAVGVLLIVRRKPQAVTKSRVLGWALVGLAFAVLIGWAFYSEAVFDAMYG